MGEHRESASKDESLRESLEFELEQAREDDRDAWGRIWQAIVASVTAVALVLATYAQLAPDGKGPAPIPRVAYLCLILLIAIATYSYAASTAMVSTLRYQYMREIEKRLMQIEDGGMPRWKHLASTIENYNAGHLSSVYAVTHYANVVFAVAATMGFFLVTILIIFQDEPPSTTEIIVLTVFSLSVILFLLTVALASSHPRKMYQCAVRRTQERLASEQGGQVDGSQREGRSPLWAVAYFVYPRPMDVAKALFIVMGVALGGAVSGVQLSDWASMGTATVQAWLVFDVLVYQARYQWNDVRGAAEDGNNPESDKRARLPVDIVGFKPAILLSLLFCVFKLVLAAELMLAWGNTLGLAFAGCCMGVFVIGALYELARAYDCVPAVVLLVTLGYPLRVFAGMTVGLAVGGLHISQVSWWLLGVALVATAAFGLSFVGITWALEGCDYVSKSVSAHAGRQARIQARMDAEDRYKSHVIWMYRQVGRSYRQEYPLIPRGTLRTAWNIGITISLALMSIYVVLISRMHPYAIAMCLLYAGILWHGIFTSAKRTPDCVLTAMLMALALLALIRGHANWLGGPIATVLLFSMGVYLLFYLWFRCMNYSEMTGMLEEIGKALEAVSGALRKVVLGEKTMRSYIESE